MNRCYVCNADECDSCQAIGGEVAECPRPIEPAAVLREVCVFPNCPPHCNSCPDLADLPSPHVQGTGAKP